jgi:hypothetical protein
VPDLHGWITQQIDRVGASARAAEKEQGRDWRTRWEANGDYFEIIDDSGLLVADQAQPGASAHIALNDPAAILRRCAADRRILARHRLDPNAYWADAAMCEGCGTEGEMGYPRTENLNECPELLDLGHAHGLTPEVLATLDRPQEGDRPEPGPGLGVPDVIAQSFASFWLGTRPVEPSPKEKATQILGPELMKISGYVPIADDQP